MKREKRLLAWLIVLVLISVSVCTGAAVASAAEEAPVQGCRYSYQLVEVPGSDGKEYNLYVERTNVDGKPLHAGSIALAVPIPADLAFSPATGWQTSSVPYGSGGNPPPAGPAEKGVLTQGAYKDYRYISFGWYWDFGPGELPTGSAAGANRQLLGTLELPDGRTLDQIWLLPWPQTNIGRAQVSDWQTATDKEAFLEVIRNTWRMPNLNMPNEGYYQGFYASDDEDEPVNGGQQYAVDLTAGWYGFLISAYAPARPVTLRVFQKDENSQRQLVATASLTFGSSTGYFKGKIDFSKLQFQKPDGQPLTDALPTGTYELEISKVSHVKATFSGLTVTADGDVFPELLGVSVYLPCGDVTQDGMIRQVDRALLTEPSRYGKNIGTGTNEADMGFRCDLDGDGRVDQKDLSILTAPVNYGKNDLHFQY